MIISKPQRNFFLIYWGVLLLVVAFLCYRKGKKELSECILVKGVVIDQIYLRTRVGLHNSVYVWRPQISFPVGDTSYIFTDDHTTFENGEIVDVAYKRNDPHEVKVYTLMHWIDFGIIVPFLLIGGFVFCIIWISNTDYGKKPVILKGEFDEFTRR